MKRVLISGPRYYNFLSSVRDAFSRAGYETEVEGYDVPLNPYSPAARLKWKFCPDRERLLDDSSERWCSYIRGRFNEIKPDVVFILNGDIFDTATLDYFRSLAKVALWFFEVALRSAESTTKVPSEPVLIIPLRTTPW